MRVIRLFLIAFLLAQPVSAKDLPDGEFVLLGDVFPGIQAGQIVPVQAHVKITSNRLDWTFVSTFQPDDLQCQRMDKCLRAVPALSHDVKWTPDGSMTVTGSERRQGKGLTIDRAQLDGPYILDEIERLVAKGRLNLTAEGGTWSLKTRRSKARNINLLPATLANIEEALAIPYTLSQSIARLNGCVQMQVHAIRQKPTRSRSEQEVIDASRYFAKALELDAKSQYYTYTQPPEGEAEALETLQSISAMYRWSASVPPHFVAEAMRDGKRLSEDDIVELARSAADAVKSVLDEAYDAAAKEIYEDRRTELIAAIRFVTRFEMRLATGADPYEFLCADITLPL